MRKTLIVMALALAATLGWAQASGDAVKAVRETLDTIVPGEYRTYFAAEDALVKADTNALNQVYRDEYAALNAAEKQGNPTARLRARVMVLDGVMTRQAWKFSPQQVISARLTKLGYNWTGYAERIIDLQLFAIFPNHQFYSVPTLPGSNDDKTRPFLHVFAIDRNAVLTHMTKPDEMKPFFIANYDPSRTNKDTVLDRSGKVLKISGTPERPMRHAVYSWLLLTREFPPAIPMAIDEQGITVEAATIGEKLQTVASGKMNTTPKAPLWGSITVAIQFDEAGVLKAIAEKRDLQGPPPAGG